MRHETSRPISKDPYSPVFLGCYFWALHVGTAVALLEGQCLIALPLRMLTHLPPLLTVGYLSVHCQPFRDISSGSFLEKPLQPVISLHRVRNNLSMSLLGEIRGGSHPLSYVHPDPTNPSLGRHLIQYLVFGRLSSKGTHQ